MSGTCLPIVLTFFNIRNSKPAITSATNRPTRGAAGCEMYVRQLTSLFPVSHTSQHILALLYVDCGGISQHAFGTVDVCWANYFLNDLLLTPNTIPSLLVGADCDAIWSRIYVEQKACCSERQARVHR